MKRSMLCPQALLELRQMAWSELTHTLLLEYRNSKTVTEHTDLLKEGIHGLKNCIDLNGVIQIKDGLKIS